MRARVNKRVVARIAVGAPPIIALTVAHIAVQIDAKAKARADELVSGEVGLELSRSTIAGGGVMFSTANGYELSATIGQPDASGPVMGGEYELTGGFWYAQVSGDCIFDGSVNLLDHTEWIDCFAGPSASPPGDTCACFDSDHDNDVDLKDFATFLTQFQGP